MKAPAGLPEQARCYSGQEKPCGLVGRNLKQIQILGVAQLRVRGLQHREMHINMWRVQHIWGHLHFDLGPDDGRTPKLPTMWKVLGFQVEETNPHGAKGLDDATN